MDPVKAGEIDLFNRQVVGSSVRETITYDVVTDALHVAWFKRDSSEQGGRIIHSNRASQYASENFRYRPKDYDITASMVRRGNY